MKINNSAPFDFKMNVIENEIIEVEVSDLKQYGLEIKYGKYDGLILIPEISWNIFGLSARMNDEFRIGDKIKAKVLKVNNMSFSASIKEAYPELNPWRDQELLTIGNIVKAEVVSKADYGFFVELKKGLRALVINTENNATLNISETATVKISNIDYEKKKIEVLLIAP